MFCRTKGHLKNNPKHMLRRFWCHNGKRIFPIKMCLVIKQIYSIILIFFCPICVFSQQIKSKPAIDTSQLGTWAKISNAVISDDGNYVAYLVGNIPVGGHTLVIKAVNNLWEKKYLVDESYFTGFFSADNRKIIFRNGTNLNFRYLNVDSQVVIEDVLSYKIPEKNEGKWLAYQLNDTKELILLNVLTNEKKRFSGVQDYAFDDKGNTLILESDSAHSLKLVNLENGNLKTIWSSKTSIVTGYSFDKEGKKIAFMVHGGDGGRENNSVWYYSYGMTSAVLLVDKKNDEDKLLVTGLPQFSKSGDWIFFQLEEKIPAAGSKVDAVRVNVWGYKDLVIQPEQIRKLNVPKIYAAAVSISGGMFVRIEQEDEIMQLGPNMITGDYAVVSDNESNYDYWWRWSPQASFHLVSLRDGTRRCLKKESRSLYNFSFSPNGKYLVYYDIEKQHYLCYDIETSELVNITKNVPRKVSNEHLNSIDSVAVACVAGWESNDSSLLIYDNYDIWKVDPKSLKMPINITNSYGYNKQIKFRLVEGPKAIQDSRYIVYKKGDSLLLTAFDENTKYNGFYRKILNDSTPPKFLVMGPYTFFRVESQKLHFSSFSDGMQPIKAKGANCWVVQRESSAEAPNLFFTKDFMSFSSLSDLHPQKEFNWLSTELIAWKMADGRVAQGILYKPENFDPGKKYPVIFNYYQKVSHKLYEFPYPEFCTANINIPWFVSNGYLVFTPDVYFSVANSSNKTSGEWAVNSIVSAAKVLAKRPYVDSKKMAVEGHSFGAGLTLAIIGKSNLFAAALEVAGVTDPYSNYLGLMPNGSDIECSDKISLTERGQSRYGATPWQRPDLYIRSSSVINADKINTPLLIMHNMKDNQINGRQGIELYMALRRLGRKVWLLQYDNEGHSLRGNSRMDYSARLKQYFDYYLKDQLPPVWMTNGVPARLRGVELGLQLDGSGVEP